MAPTNVWFSGTTDTRELDPVFDAANYGFPNACAYLAVFGSQDLRTVPGRRRSLVYRDRRE